MGTSIQGSLNSSSKLAGGVRRSRLTRPPCKAEFYSAFDKDGISFGVECERGSPNLGISVQMLFDNDWLPNDNPSHLTMDPLRLHPAISPKRWQFHRG